MTFFLQLVGVDFCGEADAATFLAQVNEHARAVVLDLLQRGVELAAAIATARAEHVACQDTRCEHARGRGVSFIDGALDEGEVVFVVELVAVEVELEIAVVGGQMDDFHAFDELLAFASGRR